MKNVFMGVAPENYNKNILTDEELKGISRPTMLIACSDNPEPFLEMAYEYKALIPGMEWTDILGASHWPQWEKAAEVNKAAIDFYKS